jgi:type VII secretion-associated serine protease mycosin
LIRHRSLSAAAATLALTAAASLFASPAYADSIRDRQWYLQSLRIAEAHSISSGSGVTVAVVDTGSYAHPDLKNNLLDGVDETEKTNGNGQNDTVGHGTEIAALIAAHGRGSNGVQGIAPSAKILPARVMETAASASGSTVAIADGISWASGHGAKVINVSIGAGPAFALESAVTAALDNDVVVVAAAGNTSTATVIGFPAGFDGVLAVGATGRDGKHAPGSLIDAQIQICAPGVDIVSAQPKDKYSIADGTSSATAIVSGAAALVRAKFPQLSAEDVVKRLTSTADDIGPPGRDNECGFGRLNIVKALTADLPANTGTAASASPSSAPSSSSVGSGYLDPAATTAPAQAETEPASSSTPLVLGGVLVGLIVAGGLVAATVIRRRRGSGDDGSSAA